MKDFTSGIQIPWSECVAARISERHRYTLAELDRMREAIKRTNPFMDQDLQEMRLIEAEVAGITPEELEATAK